MKNTETWLKEKLADYANNPVETLEDLLGKTNDTIEQYIKSPESKAAKGVLESCLEHNNLFLREINLITINPSVEFSKLEEKGRNRAYVSLMRKHLKPGKYVKFVGQPDSILGQDLLVKGKIEEFRNEHTKIRLRVNSVWYVLFHNFEFRVSK